MKLKEHFGKNLHHAYLIEGDRESILKELYLVLENLGVETKGNSDFYNITIDTFKIEDARNLKEARNEKNFGSGRKVFLISANNFLHEAQNTLLKLFEEPIENTHFFVVVPDLGILLKTFISRFYVIRGNYTLAAEAEAEKFIKMSYLGRLDFIKSILSEEEGAKANAMQFLNSLETVLHEKPLDANVMHHIFRVREFLRTPGASMKMLLESVALATPMLK